MISAMLLSLFLPIFFVIAIFIWDISITGWLIFDIPIAVILGFFVAIFIANKNDPHYQRMKNAEKQLETKRKENIQSGEIQDENEFVNEIKKLKTRKFVFPKNLATFDINKLPSITKSKIDYFIDWVNAKDSDSKAKINLKKILLSEKLVINSSDINTKVHLANIEPGYIKSPIFSNSIEAYAMDIMEGGINLGWNDNTDSEWTEELKRITITSLHHEYFDYWPDALEMVEFDTGFDSGIFFEDLNIEIPEDKYPDITNSFEGSASGASFSGPVSDSYTLYTRVIIDTTEVKLNINNQSFQFATMDKKILILLLMASLKPQIVPKINERLSA